jgi:hypothetical protein
MAERAKGREKSHTWGTWTRCEVLSSVLAVLHYRPYRWNTPSRYCTRTGSGAAVSGYCVLLRER